MPLLQGETSVTATAAAALPPATEVTVSVKGALVASGLAPTVGVVDRDADRVAALGRVVERRAGLQVEAVAVDFEGARVGAGHGQFVFAEAVVGDLDVGDLDPRRGAAVLGERRRPGWSSVTPVGARFGAVDGA